MELERPRVGEPGSLLLVLQKTSLTPNVGWVLLTFRSVDGALDASLTRFPNGEWLIGAMVCLVGNRTGEFYC
jgi:hypothetical protein